nr:retrovirus-related Pol polyprotein from transposon TNT 1-94 [Ipomoea batatas]
MTSEPEVEVDSKKVEQMKRVISPYDLNSNDNPGNIITQVRLRGDENYDEWARAVRTSLRARRKWGFVEGTIPEPDKESSVYDDWWTVQSMLVSWIRNTIDSDLRTTISHMENAKDLWDDIKERFSVANGPRIQQIKTELSDCKQRGMSIVAYYGKLKALWDDLANYDQIPTCLCAGCKCDISTKLERRREEEKVHQFLMGLDEASYGTVRTNMLATEPLPSLNKVYAALIREERVKNATRVAEERGEVMGLAVQAGNKGKGREVTGKNVLCAGCGRTGHDISGCFKILGYPDWWGDRPPNATQTMKIGENTGTENDSEKFGVPGLSNEQWQNLLAILNTHKANGDKMTEVNGCPVGLPDGRSTIATKEGSLDLDENLRLRNDRTSRMPIGAGERRDGLYYFRKVSRAKAFKTEVVDSLDLWHKRLGHPSMRSTKLIPMVSSSEGDTTFRIEHDEIGVGDGIEYGNEWGMDASDEEENKGMKREMRSKVN